MKNVLAVLAVTLFLFGCNMNPSKETRIQKLEAEVELSLEKINQLEARLDSVEAAHQQLEMKILEL